jgi:hypothetical protein
MSSDSTIVIKFPFQQVRCVDLHCQHRERAPPPITL